MKKFLVSLMVLAMVFGLIACGQKETEEENTSEEITTKSDTSSEEDTTAEVEFPAEPMSYADYMAAELETPVFVEVYVQANQSWWDNKVTVYAADAEGNGYFLYNMACPEEDKDKIAEGAKILVKGFKAAWAGEIEITDATFEAAEGDAVIVEAVDLTDKLDAEDLIDYQNVKATFTEMTVKEISFKDSESDKDIYVTLTKGEKEYGFCVENYLCGPDTEVYKTVAALEAGDVIDVTGFVYWYEGINTHITEVVKK